MARTPKLVRWVDLVAALLARQAPIEFSEIVAHVPAYADVAAKGSRMRMFERDKDELRAFGVPIETVGEEGSAHSRYRLRGTEFYLPYLALQSGRGRVRPKRLDQYGYHALTELTFGADELSAISDAAARVQQLGDPELVREIASAMRKLAFDLPLDAGRPDDLMIAQPLASASPKILRELSQALAGRKRVTIRYRSMTENAASTQVVEPHGLFFLSGHSYLAASVAPSKSASSRGDHQGNSHPVRNYRVSRIRSAKINRKSPGKPDFTIADTFRLREHARSRQAWELGDGDITDAVVELRPADTHATGAAQAGWALGTPVLGHPDQRRFVVRRPDVFVRWLLSFGGEIVPLCPPSLVETLRERARLTRSVYA